MKLRYIAKNIRYCIMPDIYYFLVRNKAGILKFSAVFVVGIIILFTYSRVPPGAIAMPLNTHSLFENTVSIEIMSVTDNKINFRVMNDSGYYLSHSACPLSTAVLEYFDSQVWRETPWKRGFNYGFSREIGVTPPGIRYFQIDLSFYASLIPRQLYRVRFRVYGITGGLNPDDWGLGDGARHDIVAEFYWR